MANLFEKPIAANPMNTFVGLPLDFVQKTMDARQAKYDTAKADIEAQEESLLGLKFLPGDRDRHMAIQGGYETRMDKMVDEAGGDYSMIQAPLDRLKRDMRREMSYGELGYQGSNYKKAMDLKGKIDAKDLEGKVHPGGARMFNQSLQTFKTEVTAGGGFAQFQGHMPSPITNVTKYLVDEAKKINEEYTSAGNKYISTDMVGENIGAHLASDPNIEKSIQESYASMGGSGDPKEYAKFKQDLLQRVSTTVAYDENSGEGGAGGNKNAAAGTTMLGIGMPDTQGTGTHKGGTVALAREGIEWLLGTNATKEFKDFKNTTEGKRLIKQISTHTSIPFPETHAAQVDWIQSNLSKPRTADLKTRKATGTEMAEIDSMTGQFIHPELAIYDLTGRKLSRDEVADKVAGKDTETGFRAKVTNAISSGGTYAPNSIVIVGKDGNSYFQENLSSENLGSQEYANWEITKVQHTWSGKQDVSLRVPIKDSSGNTLLPAGGYTTYNEPGKGIVVVSRSGKKYAYYTKDGVPRVDPLK